MSLIHTKTMLIEQTRQSIQINFYGYPASSFKCSAMTPLISTSRAFGSHFFTAPATLTGKYALMSTEMAKTMAWIIATIKEKCVIDPTVLMQSNITINLAVTYFDKNVIKCKCHFTKQWKMVVVLFTAEQMVFKKGTLDRFLKRKLYLFFVLFFILNLYLTRQVSWEQIFIYNDGLPKGKRPPVGTGAGINKSKYICKYRTKHTTRETTLHPVRGYRRTGPQCLPTPPVSASSNYAAIVCVGCHVHRSEETKAQRD